MDYVEELYQNNKLLLRAMDLPVPRKNNVPSYFDCESWINEFVFAMREGLYSLSTTLIVPSIGVRDYKSIGFIINSDKADCYHIAKTDSVSSGNVKNGDFQANKSDFDTIDELATYIKNNKATDMNEVNINVKLDGIVGLFINKCLRIEKLLKRIYVVKIMLREITGIDYPIYIYDLDIGSLNKVELSIQDEEELINSLECDKVLFWPDTSSTPSYIDLSPSKKVIR